MLKQNTCPSADWFKNAKPPTDWLKIAKREQGPPISLLQLRRIDDRHSFYPITKCRMLTLVFSHSALYAHLRRRPILLVVCGTNTNKMSLLVIHPSRFPSCQPWHTTVRTIARCHPYSCHSNSRTTTCLHRLPPS